MKKKRKKLTVIFLRLVILGIVFVLTSNLILLARGRAQLASEEEAAARDNQCILILGCGVWAGGVPSHMLEDRLNEGIRLYEAGAAPKILVSGDHGSSSYDEVNVMKQYLMDAGIPGSDIFMDHAGFSTYESIVRAKKVFGAEKMVVVTQKFHMARTLYLCRHFDIDAVGVNSDPRAYRDALRCSIREWAAREKDILYCLLNVPPTYLGEPIDLSGDGDITNDR